MRRIVNNGRIEADRWQLLPAETELADLPAAGQLILPLPLWTQAASMAPGRAFGVRLGPADPLAALLPELARIPLIAIDFPSFTDGRGYSLGRLLRQRHGFAGELRAVGDVLRDQIYFLAQCGFNAFALRPDQDLDAAVAALGDYSWVPVAGR